MLLKIILYQLTLFKLGNSVVFKNLIHIKTDKLISIVLIFIAFSANSCDTQSNFPYSRTETVIDTIHGVAFEDPYRWLEDRYSTETLDRFVKLSQSQNEIKFRLEQLRALDNNININVALANSSPIGVDTEEDYLALKKIMEYKA